MSYQTIEAELAEELEKTQIRGYVLPNGYMTQKNCLYKINEKNVNGEVKREEHLICRHTPIIKESYLSVETHQLFHKIVWEDNGRHCEHVVPASDLAIRKNLLSLADLSLAVHEGNVKELVNYFDAFNLVNQIEQKALYERIGYIKGKMIHPLFEKEFEIVPNDFGEQQLLDSFQERQTYRDWIDNVFALVKPYPVALTMVLASFASVLLKDLRVKPFIVDLAGATSKGKTTVLQVCASVWGTNELVNEWNITKVGAERKASFLNNYPLILDDTRKADTGQLQNFVYNFSGGRSKGRGTIKGSQKELTWNNILLSTGEVALADFGHQAGGVAARIIPLIDAPFSNVNHAFFNKLYKALEQSYGAIGKEFILRWEQSKSEYVEQFEVYNDQLQELATGNEVASRIARNYAALVLSAHLLNAFFNANIDIAILIDAFQTFVESNKAIDKPKQRLEDILQHLDANRNAIIYDYSTNTMTKAIFHKGELHLLPAFIQEFLGDEHNAIRSEWKRRGLTKNIIQKNGKVVDYHNIRKNKGTHKVVTISNEILNELGFDFKEMSTYENTDNINKRSEEQSSNSNKPFFTIE